MNEKQAEYIIGWICVGLAILCLIQIIRILKPLMKTHDKHWGSCMDCDWYGDLKECEIEYEPDAFKRTDKPYPVCPRCGGGVE